MSQIEHLESLETGALEALLASTQATDSTTAIRIMKLIANRAHEERDFNSMFEWNQKIIKASSAVRDDATKAYALYKAGFSLFILDRELEALQFYSQAEKEASNLSDDSLFLDCLTAQVDCYDILRDWNALITTAERALNISRIMDDHETSGEMAINLANAYYRLESVDHLDVMSENHKIGLDYAEEAYRHYSNTGDVINIARASIEICDALIALDRYPEVLTQITESIDMLIANELDNETYKRVLARSFRIKGQALQSLGEPEEAIQVLAKGHELLGQESSHGETLGILHWIKSECFQSLGDPDAAMREIQLAMKFSERSSTYDLYYRCMDELVKLLYSNDREIEALFMSRGAMTEYESNSDSLMPSHIYCSFIIHASLSLHKMDRWTELLAVVDKVHNIRDYIVPTGRAIRIDALKAEALMQIDKKEESLEILDSLLNYGEIDMEDEDIGDSLLCRALIRDQYFHAEALEDFNLGKRILEGLGLQRKVEVFVEKHPQFGATE